MECALPDTQDARDLYTLISSGIVDGMSFWLRTHDQVNPSTLTRTVTKIEELPEVTITAFPAYKEALVIAMEEERSKDIHNQAEMAEKVKKELEKF